MVVLVAAHKPCKLPEDIVYRGIQVGASLHPDIPGLLKDNTGEHISLKNPNYCELTAVYWAWKNLKEDYIGLSHYRRYFSCGNGPKWERIANGSQIKDAMKCSDILLPKKRNYFIETNYSQYTHAHHACDLDETERVIGEKYPEYLPEYHAVMSRTSGHRFNMFVMKNDIFDAYCTWLFNILFELEKRLDISEYSKNDSRVFGFVSERLLDVWIEHNHVAYTEMPVVFTERENWLKKGAAFLKRKFIGK